VRPYEKDPSAIYAASFATVRDEARLERFAPDMRPIITRLIHSCGMIEIADRLAFSPDAARVGHAALQAGAPVLCDCEMVAAGVIRRYLPAGNDVIVTLNDAAVPARAKRIGNTRSAAAVELWEPHLDGAVVAVGNAPTALFHLLELIDAGGPKPAVILGFPVGFIGAAESKAELAGNPRGCDHPQLSAFQLAAARMGWSLPDVETLTVHGRPVEQMIAFIQPDVRLLVLTTGAQTPGQIAAFLTARGFGKSKLTVLAAMGGKDEQRFDGVAEDWDHIVPAFNTLAVECIAAPDAALLPRVPGLADDLFQSDGTMTKQEVRAATVAKLMPMRGALLWDIGCGCGSVAIEWMRAARYARAIGIEPRADRRAMAGANALALGTPKLALIEGEVPAALRGLDAPDAIFIGGGLSCETWALALARRT